MPPKAQQTKKNLGKVLVVGGCGFLGHHIVNLLSDSYTCTVSVLDLRTTKNRREGVSYFDGDITDLERLDKVFREVKPDVVIHTASPVGNARIPNKILHKVNVEGTVCVIEACQMNKVKALVYTSSASVISDNMSDLVNADERWPVLRAPTQVDYYSETKAMAEQAVLEANRVQNLLTVSIRPAGIIGEGDVQAVPKMLDLYFNKKMNFQVGTNENLFDFTYVGNVAHAHCLAAASLLETASKFNSTTPPPENERVDGEAFFITNDSPVYFWDFPRMLWAAAAAHEGKSTSDTSGVWTITKEVGIPLAAAAEGVCWVLGKESTLTRKGIKFSCMTRYYDISKAKLRLGYRPIVGLREGAERAVRHIMDERRREAEKKVL